MISRRAGQIASFIAMDVHERATVLKAKGNDIIHLELGDPDFPTPDCIREAGAGAIRDGHTHYTHSQGMLALREAICADHFDRYGIEVSPERVIVTAGTSAALFLVMAVLLDAGDEVIVSDPAYACYPNFIRLFDSSPVPVDVYEEDGFQYRPEAVFGKISPKTKGIMINSPANPTGNLLSEERMAQITSAGIPVISDEIYHGLVYEGRERSILEFTDRAFVLNGFSKRFAMTGWRLGYLIAPIEYIRAMQSIQQNFFICANSISQIAGIAALKEAADEVARMRSIFNERRLAMIRGLREIGFGISVEPTGAFYVLANCKAFARDSYREAFALLNSCQVAVTPGIDFGRNAEGYLRFSYANSLARIEEALDRLKGYYGKGPVPSGVRDEKS